MVEAGRVVLTYGELAERVKQDLATFRELRCVVHGRQGMMTNTREFTAPARREPDRPLLSRRSTGISPWARSPTC
ncbi:hypothetical protein HBB16_08315 [Pseudonocardia sp. MCCB 268]|nr:hypothetical protein [Pseudonocardia cytotoxica]